MVVRNKERPAAMIRQKCIAADRLLTFLGQHRKYFSVSGVGSPYSEMWDSEVVLLLAHDLYS